jgi:hypothetical protein
MRIILQKGIDGPDSLTCLRADGSSTHAELSPASPYHDLPHLVVERALGLREGFWGMIAQGHAIADYNLPNETRPFQISAEGYQAEFLATLVQSALVTGEVSAAYVEMLRTASVAASLPFPALPAPDVLQQLIADAQALTSAWTRLPAGGEMLLEF